MAEALAQQSSEFAGVPLVGTAGVFYTNPDDIRFGLALTTAEAYRDAGLPFVVVDSSPGQYDGDDWVAAALRERGAEVLPARIGGIATQRQQGVAVAMKRGAIKVVGQEPEKPTVPWFASEICNALETSDVLVIGRTEAAEASMPPVQRETEHLAGWILQQTLDMPADALAGPRGFTVAGAEVLAAYPATKEGMNNWLYMYETVLEARRRDLPVGSLALDMIYPEAMVAEETDNPVFDGKRYDQFAMQLNHLLPLVSSAYAESGRKGYITSHTRAVLSNFGDTNEQKAASVKDLFMDFAVMARYVPPLPRSVQ